jgi:hypothetical protein
MGIVFSRIRRLTSGSICAVTARFPGVQLPSPLESAMSRARQGTVRPREQMYARCSSFIATSLDGFISRLDGAIDWLKHLSSRAFPFGFVQHRYAFEHRDA